MIVNQKKRASSANAPAVERKKSDSGYQFRFSERRVLLVLVDSLIVALAAWGASVLWEKPDGLQASVAMAGEYWYWYPVLLGGWLLLAWLNDLYDIRSTDNTPLSAMRVTIAGALSLVIYWVVHSLIPKAPHPLLFTYYLGLVLPAIALWRWAYTVSFDRPPFHHRVLIVGGGSRGQLLADILREGPGVKCNVMGYVDGNTATKEDMREDVPYLGQESDLSYLVQELGIHEIAISTEQDLENPLFQMLIDCQAQGVRVSWLPSLYGKFYRQIPMEYVDPAWALHAMQERPIFSRLQQSNKRLLDLTLVVLALPFLLLFFLPIAVAIRLDSEGPVFYRQMRSGRGNRPFRIFKFRTMYVDAEKDGKARWATENDPRVTRVGRFLRKSRLDELPQVLNVLSGDMSLVGPRPERPEFVEELQEIVSFYRTRMMVKPGITGWAQIHYDYGNSEEDASIKLQYDFYYIHHWSLWMDLYILYRTVGVVAQLKGT